MEDKKEKLTVWLAYRLLDEGADVIGVFTSEDDAYHCIDCEGGDYVEQAEVQADYKNDKGRIYRIRLTEGQDYDDIKEYISTIKSISSFDEKDVAQAVKWDKTKDGKAQIVASVRAVNRFVAFSLVEQLLTKRSGEFPHELGQWYEFPTMRQLHVRQLTDFERHCYDCLMAGSGRQEGSDSLSRYAGVNDILMRDLGNGEVEFKVPTVKIDHSED